MTEYLRLSKLVRPDEIEFLDSGLTWLTRMVYVRTTDLGHRQDGHVPAEELGRLIDW